MSKPLTVSAVGFAWYYRGDYPRILQIMTDADVLPSTYDKWIRAAESAEKQAQKSGRQVVRAIIDPDTFVTWCAARNMEPNAEARMAYANEEAYRAVKGRH